MSRRKIPLRDVILGHGHPPNRFNGLYGAARAAELAGKPEIANSYYAQLLKVCDSGHSDRPELERARKLVAKK